MERAKQKQGSVALSASFPEDLIEPMDYRAGKLRLNRSTYIVALILADLERRARFWHNIKQ